MADGVKDGEVGAISRRDGLSREKRQALIDAAVDEFNEHGLENASFNRIIERSGISKGTVYYYFENKDALLEMVLQDIGERALRALPERALPETEEEYWPVLWEEQEREFDFFVDNPELGQIMMLSLGECEARDGTEKMLCGSLLHLFRRREALIRRGQELGLVRSDLDTGLLMNVMRSIAKSLCVSIFGADVRSFTTLPAVERADRSRRYLALMEDMAFRLLSASEVEADGIFERWRATEEGAILSLRSGSMSFVK